MNQEIKNKGEIVIYQTPDGVAELDVRLEKDTAWLTQAQMVALFQRDRTVIGKHIRNIFAEGKLQEEVVCANFAHTTQHGAVEGKTQTSSVQLYNLDVIISVGYRVKSQRGTQYGNKRIAAFLFLWFLEKNGILYKPNGLRLIENNTLVALTLMIAGAGQKRKMRL